MSVDDEDIEGAEITTVFIFLGFAFFNGVVAAVTVPAAATVLFTSLESWQRVALSVFGFAFIFLIDLYVVSQYPAPSRWSAAISYDVSGQPFIVPPMPGLLHRLKFLAWRLVLTVFLAATLGTGILIAANAAEIEGVKYDIALADARVREDDDYQARLTNAAAVIPEAAKRVVTAKSARDKAQQAQTDAKTQLDKAQATFDKSDKKYKCEIGALGASACAGIADAGPGEGTRIARQQRRDGNKDLTQAGKAYDLRTKDLNEAENKVTAANASLKTVQDTYKDLKAEGPPSRNPGWKPVLDLSGFNLTYRAFEAIAQKSAYGWWANLGWHGLIFLLDMIPVMAKFIAGYPIYEVRRSRRHHAQLNADADRQREVEWERRQHAVLRDMEDTARQAPAAQAIVDTAVARALAESYEDFGLPPASAAPAPVDRRPLADRIAYARQRAERAFLASEAGQKIVSDAVEGSLRDFYAQPQGGRDIAEAGARPSTAPPAEDPMRPPEPEDRSNARESAASALWPNLSRTPPAPPRAASSAAPFLERLAPPGRPYFLQARSFLWVIGPSIVPPHYSQSDVRLVARLVADRTRPRVDPAVDVAVIKRLPEQEAWELNDLYKRMGLNTHRVQFVGPIKALDALEPEERERQAGLRFTEGLMFPYCPRTDAERYWLGAESARPPLTFADVAQLGDGVLAALGDIWNENYIHNDVKLRNVIVQGDYRTPRAFKRQASSTRYLLDDLASMTEPGAPKRGTPACTAPEDAGRAHQVATIAGDVFALGSSLFHLVAGVTPNHLIRDELGLQIRSPGWHAHYGDFHEHHLAQFMPAGSEVGDAILAMIDPDPDARAPGGHPSLLRRWRAASDATDPSRLIPIPPRRSGGPRPSPAGWSDETLAFLSSIGYTT
jgi:serine/threonine protein kinase